MSDAFFGFSDLCILDVRDEIALSILQVVILSDINEEKYLIDRQEVDAKHDL